MSKVQVTKIFKFEACHYLPHYVGKCHNLHGHSYKLEVTVTGPLITEGEKTGMIIDFGDLKSIVKKLVVDKYDHSNLNEFFKDPTAENMVSVIAETLMRNLPEEIKG